MNTLRRAGILLLTWVLAVAFLVVPLMVGVRTLFEAPTNAAPRIVFSVLISLAGVAISVGIGFAGIQWAARK